LIQQRRKGDLLLTDGQGSYAVIEVKWLDFRSSGKTATTKRTKHRGKVLDQAAAYAHALAHRLEQLGQGFKCIEGYALTNEKSQLQKVVTIPSP